jgi:CDP-diacylglycerol--serine O-phosphatidyltransferase
MGAGLISIFLAIRFQILAAGLLILISVIFDSFDGVVARYLKVESSFGVQLDSLSDLICFGIAPIILVYQHLVLRDINVYWLIPLFLLLVWAGAFRLARFNLEPSKENIHEETRGITITNSGAILTIAVLSDLSRAQPTLAIGSYSILLLILSYMMVSKLKLPSLTWLFKSKVMIFFYLSVGVILGFISSFFTSLLVLILGGLAASITRKIYVLLFQKV